MMALLKMIHTLPRNLKQPCCKYSRICKSTAIVQPRNELSDTKQTRDRKTPFHNELNIQLISDGLQKQIFKKESESRLSNSDLQEAKKHLKQHGLWDKNIEPLKDIDFKLPELHGENINKHFEYIAKCQTDAYVKCAEAIATLTVPSMPATWVKKSGWTCYNPVTKTAYSVECPLEAAIVFDVETLVSEDNIPVMAVALTDKAWYSWCSDRLINTKSVPHEGYKTLENLIPMSNFEANSQESLVIGHNVGFDRSFIAEQYLIKHPSMRFLDTMSLHIILSGQTSFQRILYQASKSHSNRKEVREREEKALIRGPPTTEWMKETSLNNLNDVYELHCSGGSLKKDIRQTFVKGSINDVRVDFQNLMMYCADDVKATQKVFAKIWPQFVERLPHPVSLAGMLEMGTTYLPINENWLKYIRNAQTVYEEKKEELLLILSELANDACKLGKNKNYQRDLWLWNQDWTIRKSKSSKRTVYLEGNPVWYYKLWPRKKDLEAGAQPGPSLISTKTRVTPSLLRLTWDGFPLHYDKKQGWGYLVPWVESDATELDEECDEEVEKTNNENLNAFPLQELRDFCFKNSPAYLRALENTPMKLQVALDQLYSKYEVTEDEETRITQWRLIKQLEEEVDSKLKSKKSKEGLTSAGQCYHVGNGPYDIGIHGVDFFRLPHKDGSQNKVGNPLAKDFMAKIEAGVLKSASGDQASKVLKLSNMCSYWENSKKRIMGQMAVSLNESQLPEAVVKSTDFNPSGLHGAILPRVVTAGTVTRRAVEPTWLTASNAYEDRIGSELKGMVQCAPGYNFVGADVDSQELWIAAILGDAYFKGVHGCTAFGWMNLCGNKKDGTDLHSKTANLVGISRDQAKVFNYGRIYGAGRKFAEMLLMQFNHRLTEEQAKAKAAAMYTATKGKQIRKSKNGNVVQSKAQGRWIGGSESYMFNQLEAIATSSQPETPVLGCKISKALEPDNVGEDFITSRVNWVVQSSAVDYLHLMLVCMKWLCDMFDIDGRFCISIHDEVRYLVKSEDRYRAALALQITNLLTRSMFAYKLGMNDLPQAVAFFSAVDIDTCLRKEVTLDCRTPSNPGGLLQTYHVPYGEALTIYDILDKTNGSLRKEDQPL